MFVQSLSQDPLARGLREILDRFSDQIDGFARRHLFSSKESFADVLDRFRILSSRNAGISGLSPDPWEVEVLESQQRRLCATNWQVDNYSASGDPRRALFAGLPGPALVAAFRVGTHDDLVTALELALQEDVYTGPICW